MNPPVDIRAVGAHEILVTWEDDHRSLYSARALRAACPCASCVEEWSGRRVVQPENIPERLEMRRWSGVGRYAVKFEWSDGHQTGIYSFDYLRRLCPCERCRNQ